MGKWKQVQAYGEGVPFPIEYSFAHFQKASGILLLDATFTKVGGEERAVHIAYDLAIGVVDFWIDDTENKTAYWYMLRRLKERGYQVRCIIGDGHWGIIHLVRELCVPFQWCHYHLLRELKRKLKKGLGALEGEAAIIFRRCRWILAARSMEGASERVWVFGKEYAQHFPKKHAVITWFLRHLDHATTFLSFPGETIPSGTYLLENFNGQIKQRLKTTRGMKSDPALENLLKILCFFTFCK